MREIPRLRRFEPLPEHTEFVDDFDQLELDEHNWKDDADDSLRDGAAPPLVKRLARRLVNRG